MFAFVSKDFLQFVICPFVCATVVLIVLLKYVRPRFPVSVNCWFCNKNSTVPYGNKNCWDCPQCEQYNGFCHNGDYNKPIPSQYDEMFNPSNKSGMTVQSKLDKMGNGLCEVCNRNQLLKIKQLAAFVPQHEESFDIEVESYEKHLDSVYKLCSLCEAVLRQKLGQQDFSMRGQVLSWKLRQKQRLVSTPPKQFFSHVPRYIKLLQLCSLIAITLICVQSIHLLQIETRQEVFPLQKVLSPEILKLLVSEEECDPLFSLLGFFILITTILAAGKDRLRVVDALDCFVWLIVLFIQLPFMAALFSSKEDRLILQGLLAFTGIVFTVGCFVCKRPIVSCRRSWSGIRLNTSSCSSQSDRSSCSESFGSSPPSVWQNDRNRYAKLSDSGRPFELLQDHQISTTTRSSASGKSTAAPNLDFTLGSHLQAMQISTPRKPQSVSGIFTPKIYSSQTSLGMTSHHGVPFHRSILSPPRLQTKSIAHSSWVAGGYWASTSTPYKGRSLFGSQVDLCSGLSHENSSVGHFVKGYSRSLGVSCSCPTSRANSVCGDDKLSVFSEPAHVASPSVPFLPRRGRSDYPPERFSPIRDVSVEHSLSSGSSSSNSSNSSVRSRKSFMTIPEKNVAHTTDNQFQQTLKKGGWKSSICFKALVGFSLVTNVALFTFLIATYAS